MIKDLIFSNVNNVVVADGQFPKSVIIKNILKNANTIICCDGAINNLIKYNIIPNYIVGDCDSISSRIADKYNTKIITIKDQNSNDLTKAIHFAKKLKLDNIIIMGATNLREDHSLANISLLSSYATLFKKIIMISDYGVFTPLIDSKILLNSFFGQQISFFTFEFNAEVTCLELKWPLKNFQFTYFYSGTLNEATSNILQIESKGSILIYQVFSENKT